jgi:hypothetical protein
VKVKQEEGVSGNTGSGGGGGGGSGGGSGGGLKVKQEEGLVGGGGGDGGSETSGSGCSSRNFRPSVDQPATERCRNACSCCLVVSAANAMAFSAAPK